MVGGRGLESVEHVFDAQLHVLGQLRDGRRAAGVRGQLALDLLDLQRAFLCAAGDMHAPAEVSEVALQLADDRRHRER